MTVWEFVVRAGQDAEFERAYGPEGEWIQLFRRGQGYIETEMFRDVEIRGRYLTVDKWTSRENYELFRRQVQSDYLALDRRCEALTEREKHLGSFELLD